MEVYRQLLNKFVSVYIAKMILLIRACFIFRFFMDLFLYLLLLMFWCQIIVYNASHYGSSLTCMGRNLHLRYVNPLAPEFSFKF